MRITTVYTRTGDAGQTRLAGGQQVWQDTVRVEAYGTVLAKEEAVDPAVTTFLNRLSDALYVLARWAAKTQGESEFLWERNVEGLR